MMVMYMFYASFSFFFTVITHYTGKKQAGSAFYSFKSCSKQSAATNKNVKFNCPLRPKGQAALLVTNGCTSMSKPIII